MGLDKANLLRPVLRLKMALAVILHDIPFKMGQIIANMSAAGVTLEKSGPVELRGFAFSEGLAAWISISVLVLGLIKQAVFEQVGKESYLPAR